MPITGVGARVVFHVQPNHRYPGKLMAVNVGREPPRHQEELLQKVLDTMGDPQWERCVTVRDTTKSLWALEHREEAKQQFQQRRRQQQHQTNTSSSGGGRTVESELDARWFPVRREDLIQRVEALHVFGQLTHPMQQCRLEAERIDVFAK